MVAAHAGRRRASGEPAAPAAGSPCAGSSAHSRASIAWPPASWRASAASCVSGSGSPAATRSCHSTRSMPVSASVTGCSTCSRVFISMKKNVPSRHAAGTRPCRRRRSRRRAPAAPRPRPSRARSAGVDRGRGRLLDQLLVAALHRAVALAEMDHVAVRVAEDLHLDVARAVQRRARGSAARRRRRPRPRAARRRARRASSGVVDEPHAAPAAAGARLDEQRVADARRRVGEAGIGLVVAVVARHAPARRRAAMRGAPRPCRPSPRIAAGGGPTQTSPASSTACAKAAFSARKP